ncbi:MAG: hypothetical protein FWD47_09735 [Treponema sp.]|nr:hypothetical protein [Treponema sp.]
MTWRDNTTRFLIFLVIILIVVICYGIIPITGGFFNRFKWNRFRNRFNFLRLKSLLDYRQYRQLGNENNLRIINSTSDIYRFTGNIESITDGNTLWVRGDDLTIPVSLEKTKCFLLPMHEGEEESEGEAPQQIRWNRVSTLSEGTKVFIGGQIRTEDNRLSFISSKEQPLMIIFYSCPDDELTGRIIRSARTRNEYWNSITPASLVIGALALISIAASFLGRPAFRLTVITSFVAVFIPILPVLPPGFLLTVLYRRLTWNARRLRVDWDLLHFDLLPDVPKSLEKKYAIRAYSLEALAWMIMLLGAAVNVVFIFLILFVFNIISF